MDKGKIVLFIGGSRSGKSSWAEKYAASMSEQVIYLATAGIYDDEMRRRVALHRDRRPANWHTVEENIDIAGILGALPVGSTVLIDCLTLWISNMLLELTKAGQPEVDVNNVQYDAAEQKIVLHCQRVIEIARENDLNLIMVSNEVGCGLVPDNKLGRKYRDIAGRVNQLTAEAASQVILVVAGIPVDIKQLTININQGGI